MKFEEEIMGMEEERLTKRCWREKEEREKEDRYSREKA